MPDLLLETRGLTHRYGDVVALLDVDLAVPPGRVGLVGANGAGKTTFLKILLGILDPPAGSVRVLETDVRTDPLEVRERVGFMPEAACLPRDQTAADFIGYTAELAGLPPRAARQRASDVLTLTGLHEERFRPLGGFSTGMQQRAKLAQALVHDPALVLLDEPTAGLDPEGREEMLDLIVRLGGFGINVVVSSHVLPDIERTCEWVIMLDGGKVLRSGPIAGLEETGAIEVELLDDATAVAEALRTRGLLVDAEGHRMTVRPGSAALDPFAVILDALADQGAGLRRMAKRSLTLEDVFLGAETESDSRP